MKKTALKFLLLLLTSFVSLNLLAQQTVTQEIPMADQMRADGKIWVVVAVIAVIFVGLILFLVNTDRKVSKLEKELKK
jgi:CcmD family protein